MTAWVRVVLVGAPTMVDISPRGWDIILLVRRNQDWILWLRPVAVRVGFTGAQNSPTEFCVICSFPVISSKVSKTPPSEFWPSSTFWEDFKGAQNSSPGVLRIFKITRREV